jgi:hypothetical protein
LYKDDETYTLSLRSVLLLSKAATGDIAAVKRELEHFEPGMFGQDFVRGMAIKSLTRKADEKRLRNLAAWFESLSDAQQRISCYLLVCETLLENSKPQPKPKP